MIVEAICDSFQLELFKKIHDFAGGNFFGLALYTNVANLGPATTIYTTVGEVPDGNGYVAGGQNVYAKLSASPPTILTFTDFTGGRYFVSWAGPITARGALIYNQSEGNKAIAVMDFGSDQTLSPFEVWFPLNFITLGLC